MHLHVIYYTNVLIFHDILQRYFTMVYYNDIVLKQYPYSAFLIVQLFKSNVQFLCKFHKKKI
jgi:hypothetical protein